MKQLLCLIVLCLLSSTTVRGAAPTTPTPWYVVSSGTRTSDLSKLKPSFLHPSPPTPPKKSSPGTMESVALGFLLVSFVSDLVEERGLVVEPTVPVLVTNASVFLAWKTSLLFQKLDFPAFSRLVYAGNFLWNHRRTLKAQCKLWKRELNWRLGQFKTFLDEKVSQFQSWYAVEKSRWEKQSDAMEKYRWKKQQDLDETLWQFRGWYAMEKYRWKKRSCAMEKYRWKKQQDLRDLLIAIIFSDED